MISNTSIYLPFFLSVVPAVVVTCLLGGVAIRVTVTTGFPLSCPELLVLPLTNDEPANDWGK